jgi:HK97 family phage portal protein
MGLFDFLRRPSHEAATHQAVSASVGESGMFSSLNDPAFYEFVRNGSGNVTESGATVTIKSAMKNTTVLRCVSLLSFSIGMLPLHLQHKGTKENATEHPLYRVLHRRPNAWQTAFEFRVFMEQLALQYGSAFARIIRSGNRIVQLIPLPYGIPKIDQNLDFTLRYEFTKPGGGKLVLNQSDVFHVRFGLSEDGKTGLSLVKQSAEAIGLAIQASTAAARLFQNGMQVGGALKHPGQLSPEAYERLKASMNEGQGAGNAHKWKILEEGMELQGMSQSSKDSENMDNRKFQIEDIARPFGVPRPLLAMDDTSWGSGIDVLGQLFVRYGLNPWFVAWEQGIERDLLTEAEADQYEAKFNAGALLRGSMKDQAEFFAKALGAGGHQPWMKWQEVRELSDLPELDETPPPPPGLVGKGGSHDTSQAT